MFLSDNMFFRMFSLSMISWGIKRTLDDQIGSQDTHGRDTNAGLGGAVGSAEAGEDDGRRAAHRAEEGLLTRNVSVIKRFCMFGKALREELMS